MASYYIWFKALHIAFVITWFAGLFYLPRLFIYHVQAPDAESRTRFTLMQRRLLAIMTIGATLAWVFGLTLAIGNPTLMHSTWFQVKFVLVIGLVVYHYRCWLWICRLRDTDQTQDSKWLRWFNEIPVLFLFAIVILAVVKPF